MSESLVPDRVCVVIGRSRRKMVNVELLEAARRGAKFVEMRLDLLTRAPEFKKLLADKPCPVVATLRRTADGGRWAGTEEARQMLLRQCIVNGFDWVDIETDIADRIRRYGSVKRIVSYHNINDTPSDLEAIYDKMCQQDADVLKLAVTARTPADNLRILKLLQGAKKPTVAHCMGDLGFPTRFLSLKFGAAFMYCAFNRERGIAPGLPSFDELQNVYGVERINADTQVFGLLGDPVAHSLSPTLHNSLFRKLNVNALYLPMRVGRDEFGRVLNAYHSIPVVGYSVTIPHKEAAEESAASVEATVEKTRAANTLIRQEPSGYKAYNTDYQGILDSLNAHLPAWTNDEGQPMTLAGAKVLILGAGGVARAAAHAVRSAGAEVVLASRTASRASELADEVQGKAIDWVARHKDECDIVINCTPIGMHPNVDDSPLHVSFLRPGLVVFDTVYTPETTLLVREARARSCRVITGVELFVRQAAVQFKLFTGIDAPFEDSLTILRQALSPVHSRPAPEPPPPPADENDGESDE